MKTIVELLIVFVLSALLGTSAKSAVQIKGLQILSIKIRDAQSLTSRTADEMKTIVELLIVFVLSALLGTSAKSAIQLKGLQILSIKIRDA